MKSVWFLVISFKFSEARALSLESSCLYIVISIPKIDIVNAKI